ncbi:MAG: hypothetical protein ACRENN_00915 [Candidatus Eiseniibacteriota bacterium]
MKSLQGCRAWSGFIVLWLGLTALLSAPQPAAATEFNFRGNLDLVVTDKGEGTEVNYLWGDSQFNSYRLRMFATAAVSDHLDFFGEALGNESVGLIPFGAYATFHPKPGTDLNLEAGLIPWPIGDWAPRSTSDKNPLVGFPLMYQYHTSLRQDVMPATTDELLSQAGEGEEGVSFGGSGDFNGMPIVYDQWWDFGGVLIGSARPFEYSLGFVNGSPGFPSPGEDNTPGKSFMGRLGLAPLAGLRFGVSGSYGPYLNEESVKPTLAPGQKIGSYNQVLRMADFQYSIGHADFHAEGFMNTWETPTIGDLRVHGGYAELKYALPRGFYVAGRYNVQRYSDVKDSTGTTMTWDADVDRLEVGGGYRITKGVTAKMVYQQNTLQPPDKTLEAEKLPVWVGQVSIAF